MLLEKPLKGLYLKSRENEVTGMAFLWRTGRVRLDIEADIQPYPKLYVPLYVNAALRSQ